MASPSERKLDILITGAGGFIGQALASALLSDAAVRSIILTDVVEPPVPQSKGSGVKVSGHQADLTSRHDCESLFKAPFHLVYLLHGIMSSQSEANLELGIQVNLDSTRQILDILRNANPGVKIVYPSSLAVYGPPEGGELTTERIAPAPRSSYGAQKLICETLLNDFSRRGLLDARILRLPTVSYGGKSDSPSTRANSLLELGR